jgi:hypothetical protein
MIVGQLALEDPTGIDRLVVCARLKPGTDERVSDLIAEGPPFDPATAGFARHTVYRAGDEVVFVFEGARIADLLGAIINDPLRSDAIMRWASVVRGRPRIARPVYTWEADTGTRGAP